VIVVVSGWATAGKDTIADHLVERYGFRKTFMSKPLHQALLTLDPQVQVTRAEYEALGGKTAWIERIGDNELVEFPGMFYVSYATATEVWGYDPSKTIADYRRLLQRLGTEVGRDMFGENVWLDKVSEECMDNAYDEQHTVVTGVRFPNELKRFRSLHTWPGGTTEAWYVTRPGIEPALGHAGETLLHQGMFDYAFQNNREIADLLSKVDRHIEAHLSHLF
jgi:hypothetical protein